MGRFPALEKELLERLSERPYTQAELVKATGRHKQSISRKLKELVEKGYVTRIGNEYHITENGRKRLTELNERLHNRLIYDQEISAPKLLSPKILFLSDLPSPCRYRARLYVDDSLEEEFREGRMHYLWTEERITDDKLLRQKTASEELRERTVEEIAQKAVSELALNVILTRLLYLISEKRIEGAEISKRDLKESLRFNFTLTVEYDNVLTKESGEILVALLGLWSIDRCWGIAGASTVDVLRVLTNLGYGPKRIADLVEKLHGKTEVKIEEEDLEDLSGESVSIVQRHSMRPLKKDEALKLKKELFKLCLKILRKHRRVLRRDYERWMVLAESLFKPKKIYKAYK